MAWTDKLAAFAEGAASMAPTAMRMRSQRHQEQRQREQDELARQRHADSQGRHEDTQQQSLVDDLFNTALASLDLGTVEQVRKLDPERADVPNVAFAKMPVSAVARSVRLASDAT